MKIALAQINPTVGDIDGNSALICGQIDAARRGGAELVVFPELAVFGYPPKDLVHRQDLVRRNVEAVESIARTCTDIAVVVGYVQPDVSGAGTGVFNAAAICRDGRIEGSYQKALLPTYDVFDESRYFNQGRTPLVFPLGAQTRRASIGVSICEDLWNDHQFEGRRVYGVDPVQRTADAGAEVLINLSASPFQAGKHQVREMIFGEQVREHRLTLLYVNQVGGNDDLIFDGGSLVLDSRGHVVARAKAFAEDLLMVDLANLLGSRVETYPDRLGSVRRALVLGLRDYVHKCGFTSVVLGVSGGIDSALTAALAVEALGREHVHCVAMPTRFSSEHSVTDARQLCENLGVDFRVLPIESVHRAMEEAIVPQFAGRPRDIAEENLQARIRGNLLMALSNKFGWLLLTTGNKSELAVGYCTLYGDMCGGLAVISDVPKTVVWELAEHINDTWGGPCIPQNTIDKPPSAELRENQLDTDSLPPYPLLDAILERFVERELSVDDIVGEGFERCVVERVVRMVDRSEYKRKQAAIGLRVTSRAFGTGRRVPVAMKIHAYSAQCAATERETSKRPNVETSKR